MKTLKQILEVYSPKSADEKRFVKKHITIKHPDVAGNGDDVFKGAKVKAVDRLKERHGYKAGDDEAVYEENESLDEAETHRVNVVVSDPNSTSVSQRKTKIQKIVRLKANDKDNAINKATAYYQKRGYKVHDHNYIGQVNEEEQIDELSKATLGSYVKKASAAAVSSTTKSQQYGNLAKDAEKRAKDPKLAFAKAGNKAIAVSQAKSATTNAAKAEKRSSGVNKAVDRLTKEETEQVDEVMHVFHSTSPGAKMQRFHKDSPAPGAKAHRDATAAAVKHLRSTGALNRKSLSYGSTDDIKTPKDGTIRAIKREEFEGINDPLIEEMLNEVLAKDASAGDYISDFVKSDNPKFSGKSKAKRIKMALGAYYSKQRGE